MTQVTSYEKADIRHDSGEIFDKGNWGVDPCNRDFNPPQKDIRNGSVDARDAFALADTFAQLYGLEISPSPGTYYIASNLTIASAVRFRAGVVMLPASGVTVTFSSEVYGPPLRQILSAASGGAFVFSSPASPIYPQWFGALGNDTDSDKTTNGTAIAAALSAAPNYGVIEFPATSGPIVVDREFILTKPVTLRGPGRIRLASSSAIWSDTANAYGRYIFHVRASNVKLLRLYIDGNSRNNSYVSSGTKYVNNGYNCGLVILGFYGSGLSVSDLADIEIDGCTFTDSPQQGVDSFQGSANAIYNLRITNNRFEKCQGVQIALSDCRNAVVTGNTHYNPYFAAFQFYYRNRNCTYTDNTVYVDSSAANFTYVDPTLKTTTDLANTIFTYSGEVLLGKLDTEANIACDCTNNRLYGAAMTVQIGMEYSRIADNSIHKSETYGLYYGIATGGVGNSVVNNKISLCDQSGLYLDTAANAVRVEGNELYGNCTRLLSETYGGRDLRSQIFLADKDFLLKRNFARLVGSSAAYGIVLHSTASSAYTVLMKENDFEGSGVTSDYLTNDGSSPPSAQATNYIGQPYVWEYANAAYQTGRTLDSPPSNKAGMVFATCGVEAGIYRIDTDGATTTVALVVGTANAVVTDTNLKMSVVASGNGWYFRQQLGTTEPVTIKFFYTA